jgi:hypothetical protein
MIYSQVENVRLSHSVYDFIKEMKVKGVIENIHDDNPGLSRHEIKKYLKEIEKNKNELSLTEKKFLTKYKDEFFEEEYDPEKHWQLCNEGFGSFSSDKVKYFYVYRDENLNFFFEASGHFQYGMQFEEVSDNVFLFDGGFRLRGTLLGKLGYYFTFIKGGISGNKDVASLIKPSLNSNFKFIEELENVSNFDFTTGYLKYQTSPVEDMSISVQLGREQVKYGYGYGSKLILSGDNPNMDFIKFDFSYGIFSFSSIHASTVGEYSIDGSQNYTKYFALNKFKFMIPDLFEVGIGEAVVYADRGLDFGYFNPFIFYTFVEHSLQDRDNATFFMDIQSNFVNNLEFQASVFFDENILTSFGDETIGDFDSFKNKTAYQLGAFWYSPFSINDLSIVTEYTRIRPYVYTHKNSKNTYTAFGQNLGHRIGPNADEIMLGLNYNFNEWIRTELEYRKVRSGENVYDENGELVFNSGGDIFQSIRNDIDDEHVKFLAGERIDNNIFSVLLRIEPIRDLIFDIVYVNNCQENITNGISENISYGYIKMNVEF